MVVDPAGVALLLGLLSPVFYEASSLPAWLAPVAWLSPYSHAALHVRLLLEDGSPHWFAALGTLALALAYHGVAYRLLEWD